MTAGATFADAMLAGYQALLCASHCLYLTEPRKDAPDAQFAIANRLSHFLWNSRPDDELAQLAQSVDLAESPAADREQLALARLDEEVGTIVAWITDVQGEVATKILA